MSIETVQHAVHVRNVLGHVSHALKAVGVFGKLDNVVVNNQPASEYIADLLPALDDAASAVDSLVKAGWRVTRAFRALGEDGPSIFLRQKQVTECEQAMVALDAALAAMADAP